MNIEITSTAKDELKKVLANKKNEDKLLRIYIAGYG
jgi:Fe-S cluster assembly iron-binding protein IscA